MLQWQGPIIQVLGLPAELPSAEVVRSAYRTTAGWEGADGSRTCLVLEPEQEAAAEEPMTVRQAVPHDFEKGIVAPW